jgi:arsenate reductase
MPGARIYNVLFLCTGNSARSIIAEVILNRVGRERFRAFSAGSHPKGEVHPRTFEVLQDFGESETGFCRRLQRSQETHVICRRTGSP